MNFNKSISRVVAWATLAAFTYSFILAEPLLAATELARDRNAAKEIGARMDDFILPYRYGRVIGGGFKGTDSLVVCIQDLHCHPEVQRNISRIIGLLDTKYHVSKVFLEGAPDGKLSTGLLRSIPDKKVKQRTLETLMDKGLLTGAEYDAVSRDRDNIYGLENWPLYRENLDRVQGLLRNKDARTADAEALYAKVEALSARLLSPKIRKIEEYLAKYRDNDPQNRWYARIEKLGNKANEDLQWYPNLSQYVRLAGLSRKIDYRRVGQEQKRYMQELKTLLPFDVYRGLTGKMAAADQLEEYFYRLDAVSRVYTPQFESRYPDLARFLAYVRMNYEINPVNLTVEKRIFTERLLARSAVKTGDREMLFLKSMAGRFRDLANLKITTEELREFRENSEQFRMLLEKYFAPDEIGGALRLLNEKELDNFYAANIRRNSVFTETILKDVAASKNGGEAADGTYRPVLENLHAFKKIDVAVVGGFHTDIAAALEQEGVSCLVITPNVTKAYNEQTYEKVLSGTLDLRDVLTSAFAETRLRPFREFALEQLYPTLLGTLAQTKDVAATVAAVRGWLASDGAREELAQRGIRPPENIEISPLGGGTYRVAVSFNADTQHAFTVRLYEADGAPAYELVSEESPLAADGRNTPGTPASPKEDPAVIKAAKRVLKFFTFLLVMPVFFMMGAGSGFVESRTAKRSPEKNKPGDGKHFEKISAGQRQEMLRYIEGTLNKETGLKEGGLAGNIVTWIREFASEETGYLPPDHIVVDEGGNATFVDDRTSTTDIGIYLQALALAADRNLIAKDEVMRRYDAVMRMFEEQWEIAKVDRTHTQSEIVYKMPAVDPKTKERYDTFQPVNWIHAIHRKRGEKPQPEGAWHQDGDWLPPEMRAHRMISCVDNGNFALALMSSSRWVEKEGNKALGYRMAAFAGAMDPAGFLNQEKGLLSMVVKVRRNGQIEYAPNVINNVMSEGRSAYYLGRVFGHLRKENWKNVKAMLGGRSVYRPNPLVPFLHLDFISWGGDLFTYLLPMLWFNERGTPVGDAALKAIKIMLATRTNPFTGRMIEPVGPSETALDAQFHPAPGYPGEVPYYPIGSKFIGQARNGFKLSFRQWLNPRKDPNAERWRKRESVIEDAKLKYFQNVVCPYAIAMMGLTQDEDVALKMFDMLRMIDQKGGRTRYGQYESFVLERSLLSGMTLSPTHRFYSHHQSMMLASLCDLAAWLEQDDPSAKLASQQWTDERLDSLNLPEAQRSGPDDSARMPAKEHAQPASDDLGAPASPKGDERTSAPYTGYVNDDVVVNDAIQIYASQTGSQVWGQNNTVLAGPITFYVKDRATGEVFTIGVDRDDTVTREKGTAEGKQVIYTYTFHVTNKNGQPQGTLQVKVDASVAPSDPVAFYKLTVKNDTLSGRELELTGLLEWVMDNMGAKNDLHFTKLFVESRYNANDGAVYSRKRVALGPFATIADWFNMFKPAAFFCIAGSDGNPDDWGTSTRTMRGRFNTIRFPRGVIKGDLGREPGGYNTDPGAGFMKALSIPKGDERSITFAVGYEKTFMRARSLVHKYRDNARLKKIDEENRRLAKEGTGAKPGQYPSFNAYSIMQELRVRFDRCRIQKRFVDVVPKPHEDLVKETADRWVVPDVFQTVKPFMFILTKLNVFFTRTGENATQHGKPIRKIGVIGSLAGTGRFWQDNSQWGKITPSYIDALSELPFEGIVVSAVEGSGENERVVKQWSLTPTVMADPEGTYSGEVAKNQSYGRIIYSSNDGKIKISVTYYVSQFDDDVVFQTVQVENTTGHSLNLKFSSFIKWALGTKSESEVLTDCTFDPVSSAVMASNVSQGTPFKPGDLFFHAVVGGVTDVKESGFVKTNISEPEDPFYGLDCRVSVPNGGTKEFSYLQGRATSLEHARSMLARYNGGTNAFTSDPAREERSAARLRQCLKEAGDESESLVPYRIETPDTDLNTLINYSLPHNAIVGHFNTRSGTSQAGGAIGSRDQVQTIGRMARATGDRRYIVQLRELIMYLCSTQFEEGDIMHWNHAETDLGQRSRIEDNRLWLLWATQIYLDLTGDTEFLFNEAVPFRKGPALADGQNDRINETDPRTGERLFTKGRDGTIYEHLTKAVELSLDRLSGTNHGLAAIGSGDWNDGLNRIGPRLKGESIWLSAFLYYNLDILADINDRMHDDKFRKDAARYRAVRDDLEQLLLKNGWNGDYFIRAFLDDGTPLEWIDAIVGPWLYRAGAVNDTFSVKAIALTAYYLYFPNLDIITLINEWNEHLGIFGNFDAYPKGIRERGQYTHGVLWLIEGLYNIGEPDLGHRMLMSVAPTTHVKKDPRYGDAPWFLAADIWLNEMEGRAGYTGYSGAPGLFMSIARERELGLRFSEIVKQEVEGLEFISRRMYIDPCLPSWYAGSEHPCTTTEYFGKSKYTIIYQQPKGVTMGVEKFIVLDEASGTTWEITEPEQGIPMRNTGQDWTITIVMSAKAQQEKKGKFLEQRKRFQEFKGLEEQWNEQTPEEAYLSGKGKEKPLLKPTGDSLTAPIGTRQQKRAVTKQDLFYDGLLVPLIEQIGLGYLTLTSYLAFGLLGGAMCTVLTLAAYPLLHAALIWDKEKTRKPDDRRFRGFFDAAKRLTVPMLVPQLLVRASFLAALALLAPVTPLAAPAALLVAVVIQSAWNVGFHYLRIKGSMPALFRLASLWPGRWYRIAEELTKSALEKANWAQKNAPHIAGRQSIVRIVARTISREDIAAANAQSAYGVNMVLSGLLEEGLTEDQKIEMGLEYWNCIDVPLGTNPDGTERRENVKVYAQVSRNGQGSTTAIYLDPAPALSSEERTLAACRGSLKLIHDLIEIEALHPTLEEFGLNHPAAVEIDGRSGDRAVYAFPGMAQDSLSRSAVLKKLPFVYLVGENRPVSGGKQDLRLAALLQADLVRASGPETEAQLKSEFPMIADAVILRSFPGVENHFKAYLKELDTATALKQNYGETLTLAEMQQESIMRVSGISAQVPLAALGARTGNKAIGTLSDSLQFVDMMNNGLGMLQLSGWLPGTPAKGANVLDPVFLDLAAACRREGLAEMKVKDIEEQMHDVIPPMNEGSAITAALVDRVRAIYAQAAQDLVENKGAGAMKKIFDEVERNAALKDEAARTAAKLGIPPEAAAYLTWLLARQLRETVKQMNEAYGVSVVVEVPGSLAEQDREQAIELAGGWLEIVNGVRFDAAGLAEDQLARWAAALSRAKDVRTGGSIILLDTGKEAGRLSDACVERVRRLGCDVAFRSRGAGETLGAGGFLDVDVVAVSRSKQQRTNAVAAALQSGANVINFVAVHKEPDGKGGETLVRLAEIEAGKPGFDLLKIGTELSTMLLAGDEYRLQTPAAARDDGAAMALQATKHFSANGVMPALVGRMTRSLESVTVNGLPVRGAGVLAVVNAVNYLLAHGGAAQAELPKTLFAAVYRNLASDNEAERTVAAAVRDIERTYLRAQEAGDEAGRLRALAKLSGFLETLCGETYLRERGAGANVKGYPRLLYRKLLSSLRSMVWFGESRSGIITVNGAEKAHNDAAALESVPWLLSSRVVTAEETARLLAGYRELYARDNAVFETDALFFMESAYALNRRSAADARSALRQALLPGQRPVLEGIVNGYRSQIPYARLSLEDKVLLLNGIYVIEHLLGPARAAEYADLKDRLNADLAETFTRDGNVPEKLLLISLLGDKGVPLDTLLPGWRKTVHEARALLKGYGLERTDAAGRALLEPRLIGRYVQACKVVAKTDKMTGLEMERTIDGIGKDVAALANLLCEEGMVAETFANEFPFEPSGAPQSIASAAVIALVYENRNEWYGLKDTMTQQLKDLTDNKALDAMSAAIKAIRAAS